MTENKNTDTNGEAMTQLSPQSEEDYGAIEIPRSEEFIATAQAVSDFINRLGLPAAMNNELVELLKHHVLKAEEGGFRFGLKIGLAYARSEDSTP